MAECEICYEEMKEKINLPCAHFLCQDCYLRIRDTCPFCRHPIALNVDANEEDLALQEADPEYWLEYDPREWITFSRFLKDGREIIRTFRKSELPNTWRNDDLSTVIKRRKQRKRRQRRITN